MQYDLLADIPNHIFSVILHDILSVIPRYIVNYTMIYSQ